MPSARIVVAGIDVGGSRKGFHAVALSNGRYLAQTKSPDPEEIVKWCLDHETSAVAVDAPCQWSSTGRSRTAERALMAAGVWCFSTPSQTVGETKAFYGWMLRGAMLYASLKKHFVFYDGHNGIKGKVCFETFPHAVACALERKTLLAKNKRSDRSRILMTEGVDTIQLNSIDYIDAALCALVADRLKSGAVECFGDSSDGLIVVPSASAQFTP